MWYTTLLYRVILNLMQFVKIAVSSKQNNILLQFSRHWLMVLFFPLNICITTWFYTRLVIHLCIRTKYYCIAGQCKCIEGAVTCKIGRCSNGPYNHAPTHSHLHPQILMNLLQDLLRRFLNTLLCQKNGSQSEETQNIFSHSVNTGGPWPIA